MAQDPFSVEEKNRKFGMETHEQMQNAPFVYSCPNPVQGRPALIKRDSDVPAPQIINMDDAPYNYAKPKR